MTQRPETPEIVHLADLSERGATPFALRPDADARAALAATLDLPAIRKLSFEGDLAPEGRRDWRLTATLGATVVQECVVTLTPVTTRIDRRIVRRFLTEMPDAGAAEEIEMPEDETIEPLTPTLHLAQVMAEALVLALPDYPRAEDAELTQSTFAAPGTTPLQDSDLKPFAGLAGLKSKLEEDD